MTLKTFLEGIHVDITSVPVCMLIIQSLQAGVGHVMAIMTHLAMQEL